MRVSEFHGIEGLRELERDWRRLLHDIPDRSFQHLFETHAAYAVHVAPSEGKNPFYLALQDEAGVRAICPLEEGVERILGKNVPVWQLPLGALNLHRDLICTPDAHVRHKVLRHLVAHLQDTRSSAGWLLLERVLETSAAWRCIDEYPAGRQCVTVAPAMDEVDTARPYEEVAAARGRNFRRMLKRAYARLEDLQDVRFESTAESGSMDQQLDQFLRLEDSGWKGASGERTALLFRPGPLNFIRDISRMQAAPDRCEINTLSAAGRCIAAQICIRVGSEYVIYKIAYDEEFSAASPGQLLQDWVIQRCCADEAITRVNLVSHAAWHQPWQPRVVPAHTALIALRPISGRLLATLLRARLKLQSTAPNPDQVPPAASASDTAS